MNNHKVTVNVTNRTIVRTILWIIAAVVLFWFVRRVSHILILVFVAFFLALALNPAVGWLSRRTKIRSRIVATSAAYVIIIALLALFFALVTPPLVKQSRQFINEIPQQVENFQHQNSSLARFARKYKFDQK
ncbi:MAG TPA: AI-2E family transporter, partial [Candidatus Saccharimonadales bacterium]|nr:AI-2E family transporter [Candidatus Saccharimonadales bacterium]